MPIGKSTEESTRTGVYHVKESGLEYEHLRNPITPKDGKEYLEIFRYVETNRVQWKLWRKIIIFDNVEESINRHEEKSACPLFK